MTEEPKVGSANKPRKIRESKEREEKRLEQERAELSRLLGLPEFRRYIYRHMIDTCGLWKSPSSPNGSVQSTNIGMQDVGRTLWAEIEGNTPLALPQMMVEYYEANK